MFVCVCVSEFAVHFNLKYILPLYNVLFSLAQAV
jgi:hypothetical protein